MKAPSVKSVRCAKFCSAGDLATRFFGAAA